MGEALRREEILLGSAEGETCAQTGRGIANYKQVVM
jgi:hypothetical protein